jgi:hypothetical protein
MAEKKVPFSVDWGYNQVKTEAWTDEDRVFVESKQDVTELLRRNKMERNFSDIKFNSRFSRNAWRKVASIPNIIVDQLMREKKWDDKKYMKKWLNDPENRAFRTGGGVI